MKNILLFILFAGAMMFISAKWNTDEPHLKTSIEFSNSSWEEIVKQARAENKIIFLDIYASWCGPCKQLKKNTFTDKEVGSFFNANFINATFDAEKGEGKKLAERYVITAYPTMLFINPDGTIREAVVGYRSANQLMREAKGVLKN